MTSTSYAFVGPDQLQIMSVAIESGEPPAIQFMTDAPIPLPQHGMYPVGAWVQGEPHAIVSGHSDGAPILVNGRTRQVQVLTDGSFGTDAVWLLPDGRACYVRAATKGTTWMCGTEERPVTAPEGHTPAGFKTVHPDGTPEWTNSETWPTYQGIVFARDRESGDWTIGGATLDDPIHGPRVVAYRHSSQQVFVVWYGQSPVGFHIQEQPDGSAVAAISLPALFIPSANFAPLETTTPVPPEPTEPPPIEPPTEPPPIQPPPIIVPPEPVRRPSHTEVFFYGQVHR